MELKPGYKQTEVGVIPEDWAVKQIQDVCGFIVPGRNKPRVFDGNIPWITTPDLEDGRRVYDSRAALKVSVREASAVGSKVVPSGSVLMSCVGELGIVAIAGCDIVINQQLHAFIPSRTINAEFLAYAIKAQSSYIESTATRTTVPYLNKDNCNSIPIPLPPLTEQEAIAETLSDADAHIESFEQLIAKKRHLKRGSMQELLTGKKRLPGFEVKSGYKQTEVGLIPEDWEVERLTAICSMKSGESITSANIDQFSEYPCYGGNGLRGFTTHFTHDGRYSLIGRQGALCGNVLGVEGKLFASEHAIVVTAAPRTDIRWLTFVLHEMRLNQYSESSAQPGLSVSKLLSLQVAHPSTEAEQEAIATILSDMDAELVALEGKLTKARQLKQGMTQELLTGRIRLL